MRPIVKFGAVFVLFAAALIATLTLLIVHIVGKGEKLAPSAGMVTHPRE
jgi:hypothetical protein